MSFLPLLADVIKSEIAVGLSYHSSDEDNRLT